MRCTRCDYPLWNLRARQCPECGAPFRPSDFSFIPDSVRFCCPQCGQAYYGTGPQGHLEPRAFACVRCTAAVDMDEMVLLPAEGLRERETETLRIGWEERGRAGEGRRGFFWALFQAIGLALASPARLIRALPPEASAGRAVWLAVLINTVYALIGGAMLVVVGVGAISSTGVGFPANVLFGVVLTVLAIALLVLVGLLLWSAMTHMLLWLTGGTDGGIRRTMLCLGYSSPANVLAALPCAGPYLWVLSWIWWAIAGAVMIREAQKVSSARAFTAALIPPGLMTVVVIALLVVALFGLQQAFTSAVATAQATRAQAHTAATQRLLEALVAYAEARGGATPPHAAEVAADQGLGSLAFYLDAPPLIIQGQHWIDVVAAMPEDQRQPVLAAAAEAWPEGATAQRIGEFVFTYRGIDPRPDGGSHPDLWLIVAVPAGQPFAPATAVYVAKVSGQVEEISLLELDEALAAQNALRAEAGLPPLPDPRTVQEVDPP